MVDIIDIGFGVEELDEVLDDLDHVLLGEDTDIHVGLETELLVETVASDITKVVTLIGEEELLDGISCGSLVGWLGVAELTIYVDYSLLFGVARVFLKGIVDDGVIGDVGSLLVEEDCLSAGIDDFIDLVFVENGLAVDYDLVSLDGDDLARIFVNEVLDPRFQDTRGEFAADALLEIGLAYFDLVGKPEDCENIFIGLETDCTEHRRYGELLLTVDVGVHDIVDVGSELDP